MENISKTIKALFVKMSGDEILKYAGFLPRPSESSQRPNNSLSVVSFCPCVKKSIGISLQYLTSH